MRRIIIMTAMALILAMMPILLFSCNVPEATEAPTGTAAPTDTPTETPTEAPTEKPTEKPTEAPTEPPLDLENLSNTKFYLDNEEDLSYFKRLGRTFVEDGGLCCDQTASGIEFDGVFKGTVTLNVQVTERDYDKCYFAVYVDGERVDDYFDEDGVRTDGRFVVEAGSTDTLSLAYFAEAGRHTIRIVKQNEHRYCLANFKSLSMTGYLLDAPKNSEHYIEIIGDSITCGQGNVGVNGMTGKTVDYSDGTKTYAYLAAEALGADCSVISESAVALAGSWFGDEHTVFDNYNSYSYKRESAGTKYPFEFDRVPDLVVINLGTNDAAINKNHNPEESKPEDVKKKTKELIELIRSKYGEDVRVVWVFGMLGYSSETKNAITSALTELGGNIYKVTLSGDTAGYNAHPSGAVHRTAAAELEDFIYNNKLLG